MLNVVAVGEIQKRGSDNFNSAQIGQAISFGEKVLQLQPRRTFVYVILTDSIVINIYVVHRVSDIYGTCPPHIERTGHSGTLSNCPCPAMSQKAD
ncbi:19020_t:CDS:1, partial [Rhizophagus irregularis]